MRRFLHCCLVVMMAAALVAGGAGPCAASNGQAMTSRDSVDHSAHAGHGMTDAVSTHTDHRNPVAAARCHDRADGKQKGQGSDADSTECCIACASFNVVAASAKQSTAFQVTPLLFVITDDPFSRSIILIDPGIPKQAI